MSGQSRHAQNMARRRAAGLCDRCPQPHAEGRALCDACRAKQQAQHRAERLTMASPRRPTTRACLRCDRTFASAWPGNRLCKSCLELIDSSPTPEHIHAVPVGWV
jgi:hypothetical protein